MNNAPLDGILVVESGARIGAGVCGSILSQLGATVVYIEEEETTPNLKWRYRSVFSAGKLSVRPQMSVNADIQLINEIVENSDAVIISSDIESGIEKSLFDGWQKSRIVCDVTAYGKGGYFSGQPDTEFQIQAMSGIMDTTGMPEGEPTPISLPVVETMTGIFAAAAMTLALRVKRKTGLVQSIDMALYDCAFCAMATFLPGVLAGTADAVHRIGNHHAMISPWNVYKARDGWILICAGNDQQWKRLCQIMQRPELAGNADYAKIADRLARAHEIDAIVGAWAQDCTVSECVALLKNGSIPCGPVVEVGTCPQEPNLIHRNMIKCLYDPVAKSNVFIPGCPWQMSASPGRPPDRIPGIDVDRPQIASIIQARKMTIADQNHQNISPLGSPLDGIRVVEIGHYTTAPLATKYLASLGAEVIKIEPLEGETTRPWPPTQNGQGYFFTYMNSDKKSLALDLNTETGLLTLQKLIIKSDVLIENLKPGTLAKRGLSPADISTLNPRIIYCSLSGFGVNSVYPGRPAYDSVIQAMSGLMDLNRYSGVPLKTGISTADLLGAAFALVAVLAALEYADKEGIGQFVDISMQDTTSWMTQTAWNGNEHSQSTSVIRCIDGFIAVDMANVTSYSELPINLSIEHNVANTGMASYEALNMLSKYGIKAAPILTVTEMISSAQTKSRHLFFTVEEDGTEWPLLENPLRLTVTPPKVRRPMPSLGRDNAYISEMLMRGDRAGKMAGQDFGKFGKSSKST